MLVDTDVLVRARFEAAPEHGLARRWLQQVGESSEALRINRQVLREYLATVTRPQSWSPPIAMTAALAHVAALQTAFEILEDGPQVTEVLEKLCSNIPVAGRQVHDANIVATMLAHGEHGLLTFNPRDFHRYGKRIELLDPEALPRSRNERPDAFAAAG